jgi:membrane dipeptidase
MRLVDLYSDWSRQYATETTQYEGRLYPEVPERVGRLDGYLLGTSLAVLACALKPADWSRRADAWHALGQLLTRYEAEFTGRVIRDGGDAARWQSSPPDELCWGVIGVAGFDFLIRKPDDLDHLPVLFQRGIRVFQPVASSEGILGGSTEPGDDRGLTDLGRAFLARLTGLAHPAEPGPRPILDLAGMNAVTVADTLVWLDENRLQAGRLPLVVSHGRLGYRELIDESSVDSRNLRDLRSRGGVIGLTPGLPGCETAEDLKHLVELIAAMPFEGRAGHEGIAIGSDLLGVERTATGLASARDTTRWLARALDRETAAAVAVGNALRLLLRSAGLE